MPRTLQPDVQPANSAFSLPVSALITAPLSPRGSGPLTLVSVPVMMPHSSFEPAILLQGGSVAPNAALAAISRHNPKSNFMKKDVFGTFALLRRSPAVKTPSSIIIQSTRYDTRYAS